MQMFETANGFPVVREGNHFAVGELKPLRPDFTPTGLTPKEASSDRQDPKLPHSP